MHLLASRTNDPCVNDEPGRSAWQPLPDAER